MRIPIRPPTPTSDDFPSDSGWEKIRTHSRPRQGTEIFGIIKRGVPKRGIPQKCARGRASGATVRSGHVLTAQVIHSTVETRHFDTYQNRLGYISDTYQCAPVRLEAVPKGYPPSLHPPYDYSRICTFGDPSPLDCFLLFPPVEFFFLQLCLCYLRQKSPQNAGKVV